MKLLSFTALCLRQRAEDLLKMDYYETPGIERERIRDQAMAHICTALAGLVDEPKS